MKIIIPSSGRAQTIRTHKLLDKYLVCIPENEFKAYKKIIPQKRLIIHPDSIKGLVRKRNWILDNCMDDEAVVMIDDDITKIYNLSEIKALDKDKATELIYNTYYTAKEMGVYLFGWSNYHDTGWYNEFKPFVICCGYINGKAFGIRAGSSLRYDERFALKMDYDIALQNLFKYRMCFQNNMFGFAQEKTSRNRGGLSSIRTTIKQKEMIDLLKKKYGDIIQDKRLKATSRIRAKKIQIGVTIKMPF